MVKTIIGTISAVMWGIAIVLPGSEVAPPIWPWNVVAGVVLFCVTSYLMCWAVNKF